MKYSGFIGKTSFRLKLSRFIRIPAANRYAVADRKTIFYYYRAKFNETRAVNPSNAFLQQPLSRKA
jgi:hypothetical protein